MENTLDLMGENLGITWLIIPTTVLSIILALISIISMFKLFQKAGEKGYYSIIPIYNIIVLFRIIKLPLINLLWAFLPFVGILILTIKLSVNLAKAYGKSIGFAVGLIFLNIIFIPILAFSDNEYIYENEQKENNAEEIINNNETNNIETNNIETGNKEMVDNISINNIENTPIIEENRASINVEATPVVEPVVENLNIKEESKPEETIENINILNNEEVNPLEPIIEPVVEEGLNANLTDSSELTLNNIVNETINEETVINNIEPIVENSIIEEPTEVIEHEVIETVEQLAANMEDKNVRICKNCGAEMPNIVMICPKCQTDNE